MNTLKYSWDHVEEMLRYIVDIKRETDTDTQQSVTYELIIIIVSSVSKVPPQDLQKNNH